MFEIYKALFKVIVLPLAAWLGFSLTLFLVISQTAVYGVWCWVATITTGVVLGYPTYYRARKIEENKPLGEGKAEHRSVKFPADMGKAVKAYAEGQNRKRKAKAVI